MVIFDFSVKFKAVDKVSAKVDAINAKMRTMSDRAGKTSSKIKSTLGTGFVSTFKLKTQQALNRIKHLKKKIVEAKSKIQDVGKKALLGGTAVLGGIVGAIYQSQKVERAKGQIASLGIGAKGIDIITEKARNLSNALAGVTQTDFIQGSYDIKSGIESLSDTGVAQYTEWAGKVAVATKSNILEMGQLFAMGYGVFRGQFNDDFEFGKAFSASVSASVQMFKTDGKDIVDGLGRIKGAATQHNIAMAEQFAVLGVAKSAYKVMSEASTGYDSFLRGVIKAQDKLNLSFVDGAGMMLPMEKIIGRIKKKYGELNSTEIDNITRAFGGSEAGNFVNTMANNIDKVVAARKKLNVAQGKGMELTNRMAKSMQRGREFELLGQQMGNMFASIGRVFSPVALRLGRIFGKLTTAIQSFIVDNPRLAKVIGYTVAILGALAVVLGIVAVAMFAVSLPVLGVLAVIALLVGGLVALYVYWDDIMSTIEDTVVGAWVSIKQTWSDAMTFIFGDNRFEAWGEAVRGVFDALTSPILYVIDLIDALLSKLDIYNQIRAVGDSISEGASNAWNSAKSLVGMGDNEGQSSFVDNSTKNHTIVDVNVTALGGAKAESSARGSGGIKLRTIENGIGGV